MATESVLSLQDPFKAYARYEKQSGQKPDVNVMAAICGIGYKGAWSRYDKAKKSVAAELGDANGNVVAPDTPKKATNRKKRKNDENNNSDERSQAPSPDTATKKARTSTSTKKEGPKAANTQDKSLTGGEEDVKTVEMEEE